MISLKVNIVRNRILSNLFSLGRSGIQFFTSLFIWCFVIVLPDSVQGHEQGSKLNVQVGVRDDAKPFSYVDTTRTSELILPGYSGYSIEVCRYVLTEMRKLPQYQNYTFTAVKTKAYSRFKQLGVAGELFMLCGPDSISADRLLDFRSSHAIFLTGMTYAYINPRSPKFPRGNYCEHVVGVVRATTADTEGLEDLASRDLLMRFDDALDLEVEKKSGRVIKSQLAVQEVTRDVLENARKEYAELTDQLLHSGPLTLSDEKKERRQKLFSHSRLIDSVLTETDPAALYKELAELKNKGNGLASKIIDKMKKRYEIINAEVAREIVTAECPQGFTSMPVRKFDNHGEGIAAFCRGEVLYYLADYDILKHKIKEIAGCVRDVVMNRFTRSREVYGVYFPKNDTFDTNPASPSESEVDVANFYADFNDILLSAMQGERSMLEDLFAKEFGVQRKSDELERFFDSFKYYAQ